MIRAVRLLLLSEAAAFIVAALVHFGVLVNGYQHLKAGTAETVIGVALLVGIIVSWAHPRSSRQAALAAQGFALLGTLVGIFTIAVGVGPRTAPDIAFHIAIVLCLLSGLVMAGRSRIEQSA